MQGGIRCRREADPCIVRHEECEPATGSLPSSTKWSGTHGRKAGRPALGLFSEGRRPSGSQGTGTREVAGPHAQAQAMHRVCPRREALGTDRCGPVGGAPPGTPWESVALGRGHETESELFISHTKQMLHDQPPRVSVLSRKLLQDGCGAHAFTYPGRGGLQAHEGWVVLKTGHLCYIRH